MKIIISGSPKSGKSILLSRIISRLKNRKIAGIVSPEILSQGERAGFEIVDIASGEKRTMASLQGSGPKVSRYYVDVGNIDHIVDKFEESIATADIVVIDEIGKMELLSRKFTSVIEKIMKSGKPGIFVVGKDFVESYRSNGKVYWLTRENASEIEDEILGMLQAIRL